jgi:hypothetical protein
MCCQYCCNKAQLSVAMIIPETKQKTVIGTKIPKPTLFTSEAKSYILKCAIAV